MTETPGEKYYDLEDRTLPFAKAARNYVNKRSYRTNEYFWFYIT